MRRPADDKQARCRRAVRSRTQRRAPAGSALEHRRPDRYRAGMAQQSATPLRLIRGPSRFRLAVKPLSGPLRPYGWEIYGDDHGDGACPPIGKTLPDSEGGMGGRVDGLGYHPGALTPEPVPSAERSRWAVVVTRPRRLAAGALRNGLLVFGPGEYEADGGSQSGAGLDVQLAVARAHEALDHPQAEPGAAASRLARAVTKYLRRERDGSRSHLRTLCCIAAHVAARHERPT